MEFLLDSEPAEPANQEQNEQKNPPEPTPAFKAKMVLAGDRTLAQLAS